MNKINLDKIVTNETHIFYGFGMTTGVCLSMEGSKFTIKSFHGSHRLNLLDNSFYARGADGLNNSKLVDYNYFK